MSRSVSGLKQVQLDKANVQIVLIISIAVFITIFSLVSVKSLASRFSYQSKVISSRETARDQLIANKKAADQLTESYKRFVLNSPNVIGGDPNGQGERDGDNAKLTLDALPSVYDYPAVTSSIEKLALAQGLDMRSIEGVDDNANQNGGGTLPPELVEMPFAFSVVGNFGRLNDLVSQFERSIRPFKITKFIFNGADSGSVQLDIEGKTYYQPAENLDVKKEIVQ